MYGLPVLPVATALNFTKLLGDRRGLLDQVRIASIGPITSLTLRKQRLIVTIESPEAKIDALVRAIASGGYRRHA